MRKRSFHVQYTAQVPSQVFEWYFSERPFKPGVAGDWMASMRLEGYCKTVGFPFESMLAIKRELVPEFLADMMQQDFSAYDVFAFTLTYPQITASMALARRLKERYPDKPILFGGAGSQIHDVSARELLKVYPFLDAGVVGEGEPVLVPLIAKLLAREEPHDLPGIHYRHHGEVKQSTVCAVKHDLNDAYFPNYDEYFQTLKQLDPGTRGMMERVLPIEMGRGCAWGDKMTCKFCAFTFHGTFRRRSKERVLEEVRHQVERYFTPGEDRSTPPAGTTPAFYVVDDLVTVPMIQEIFPELRKVHPRLRIPFMEVRTALTDKHLDILAEAGVQLIQPGIESMDDGLLEKMSKGTTTFHNLMFMKGCAERGVRVSHNIILGFPDATTEDLQAQVRHLEMIPHLDPPFAIELSFVRFSPYYHEKEKYGFKNWHADEFYRSIYPDEMDIEAIAYEYQIEREVPREHQALYRRTMELIRHWQAAWMRPQRPYLWFEDRALKDGRDGGEKVYSLDDLGVRVVSEIMLKPLNIERLVEVCAASPEAITAVLQPLIDARIVLEMRGRYLCLALTPAARTALCSA